MVRRSLFFRLVFCLALAIVGTFSFQSDAHAQRIRNSDAFMKRYCFYVGAKLTGLREVVAALQRLIDAIQAIGSNLLDLRIKVRPPSLRCLNDLAVGASVSPPDLNALLSCFQGLMPRITFPNLDQLLGCLRNLIPSIQIDLPSFDPTQCLPSANFALDLSKLFQQIEAVIRAVNAVIESLKNIRALLSAGIDPQLLAHLRALLSMCREKRYRSRVRV